MRSSSATACCEAARDLRVPTAQQTLWLQMSAGMQHCVGSLTWRCDCCNGARTACTACKGEHVWLAG